MCSRFAHRLFFAVLVSVLSVPTASATVAVQVETAKSFTGGSRWRVFADGGWIRVERGGLGFYAPNGRRRRKLYLRGNEFLFGAFGARTVGVLAYADRQQRTLHAVTFNLYDTTGQRLVRVKKPPFASAIISPTGNAFVGVDGAAGLPKSVLRFYNSSGRRRQTLTVTRFTGGEFCRDGSLFFFESAGEGLQVCTAEGRSLRTLGPANRWAVSDDGRNIAILRGTRLFFYRDSHLVQMLSVGQQGNPIRDLAISPDGRFAGAVSAGQLALIDIDAAKVLWQVDLPSPSWNGRSVDVLEGAELVAVGLDYDPGENSPDRHRRSRCLILDRDGRIVHSEDNQPRKWESRYPKVRFDHDDGRLFFVNRDGFKLFRITLEEP